MNVIRHIKAALSVTICCALLLTGLSATAYRTRAAKIKLNKKKVSLTVGKTCKLKLKGTNAPVKWTSSKKKVAAVNAKGKVTAKKSGTAKITAKAGGKKYICKVTVTKKTSASRTVTPAPVITSAPPAAVTDSAAPVTSTETPGAAATTTPQPTDTPAPVSSAPAGIIFVPTYEPDEFAENFDSNAQKLSQSILITLKNNNESWMSSVDVDFVGVTTEGYEVITQSISLGAMRAGETQQFSIPVEETVIDDIDINQSYLFLYAEEADAYHRYTNQSHQITIQSDTYDTATAFLPLTFSNQAELPVTGNYTISLYDEKKTLVDAISDSYSIDPDDSYELSISLPFQTDEETGEMQLSFTTVSINYNAYSVEEIDPKEALAENITVIPQKLANSMLFTVTNNNTIWLSNVDISYDLYDTDNDYITSISGSLLSMGPGETQHVVMELDSNTLEVTELANSKATITPDENNENYSYASTTRLSSKISNPEAADYEVTLSNPSNLDIEGSYTVYFYDGQTLLDAYQEVFTVYAQDETVFYLTGPYSEDEEGNILPAATSYKLEVTAHSITYNE